MKIIAESAYNHMGNVQELIQLLHAAKGSGADFFTIQIMDPPSFSVKEYSKHQLYIDHNISFEEWDLVFAEGAKIGMPIIPCALDEKSLDYVFSKGVKMIKVHATDMTNPPFLRKIQENKEVKVVMETQAGTNLEIRFALSFIKDQVEVLLTGYSNYPTEFEDLNLDSLDFLKKEYGLPVGLADHAPCIHEVALMAMAKGCTYLEKHITITRNNRNFDWQVSLYPEEFQMFTSAIKLYSKALGTGVKHPVKNEVPHRTVLYKKVLPDGSIKRADNAPDFITHSFAQFPKDRVAIGIIARLKSQRLPKKVMAPLGEEVLIESLYNNIKRSTKASDIYLATSTVQADDELADFCASLNIPVFRGHPESVIDRLLDLAWHTKSGLVLRVTGDNPFTDVGLMDGIIDLVQQNNLDYARVNNAPFGVSAEVFSVQYLWDLYIRMENPMYSEYLTWFVLLDDEAKKGCIDVESNGRNFSLRNLSVDYPEDLEGCKRLLECAGKSKVSDVSVNELFDCAHKVLTDKKDVMMKLPGGQTILISEYIDRWKNTSYEIRKTLQV